jgi:3-isopropylmalate/(R)-2-methylmalate dehydratase large subunit
MVFGKRMTSASLAPARTIFEKIWAAHRVADRPDGQSLIYIDKHFIHDGYAPAFEFLEARGLKPRRPEGTVATPDHYVPTTVGRDADRISDPEKRDMVATLEQKSRETGITLFDLKDRRQGIVHVIGPELGISQPGMVIVCGDSHTSTHGAVGALAFGIGMTEASYVLAAQAIWQRRPKTMRITVTGKLASGVTAKDVILGIIGQIGTAGATGYAVEYAGPVIRALSMEGRLTVCNMSIEAGARAGIIAPDETTFAYLSGRPFAPAGAEWDRSIKRWRDLPTDDGARFDDEVEVHGGALRPMVSWGTSPQDVSPVDGVVPDPDTAPDMERRDTITRALAYMDLKPGTRLVDISIDRVFIGSCSNSRIEDLRSAAAIVDGRKVHPHVRAWVVPGSGSVKAQAESEGLDAVFKSAGFEWREAGCSMCLGTNGEVVAPGERCASTSNRNFVGRQGRGARTHLMSPIMAAAAAINGRISDVRQMV